MTKNHDRGSATQKRIDQNRLPTAIVLSDVLEDVINYLQTRGGHSVAIETLDALIESSGFELRQTPKSDFDAGRSVFRQHELLSLTGAIIVAAMQRDDIEYLYSFDDECDSVAGVIRLTTPDDPFG